MLSTLFLERTRMTSPYSLTLRRCHCVWFQKVRRQIQELGTDSESDCFTHSCSPSKTLYAAPGWIEPKNTLVGLCYTTEISEVFGGNIDSSKLFVYLNGCHTETLYLQNAGRSAASEQITRWKSETLLHSFFCAALVASVNLFSFSGPASSW